MLMIEPEPGENVYHFAAELVARSRLAHQPVCGLFNDYMLKAEPGMQIEDVVRPWAEDTKTE